MVLIVELFCIILVTESEGSMPMHMTVFCRGRIFAMTCVDENEEPLTPPELQQQFQYIIDKCEREPEGPGLGALTGDNRTTWAQVNRYGPLFKGITNNFI